MSAHSHQRNSTVGDLSGQVAHLQHDIVALRRLVHPEPPPSVPQIDILGPLDDLDDLNKLIHALCQEVVVDPAWEKIASRQGQVTQESFETIKTCVDGALGLPMGNALTSCQPTSAGLSPPERLALMYAFQVAVNHIVGGMAEKFCWAQQQPQDELMWKASNRAIEKETFSVFTRWRSITHKGARLRISDETRSEIWDSLAHQALFNMYSIGCYLLRANTSYPEFNELFFQKRKPEIHEILVAAYRFIARIKEEVVTADYILWAPWEGGFNPDITDIAEIVAGMPPNPRDVIYGSTRLGLYKNLRVEGVWTTPIVKRPMVVTEGVLFSVFNPPQTTLPPPPPPPPSSKPKDQKVKRPSQSSQVTKVVGKLLKDPKKSSKTS